MAIVLELEPEIESYLIAQAAAMGTSVEALLKTLVESLLNTSPQPTPITLSPKERAERFVNWALEPLRSEGGASKRRGNQP